MACGWLAGCANGGGLSAMGATLLSPWQQADVAARADALPYASLRVDTQGNEGLLVMAYQQGERGRDTFWQAADYATLHLRDGRPAATAGFEANLLGQWRTPASSERYRLHVRWRDAQGQEHRRVASARLACDAPRPLDLPLMRKTLERCTEHLTWHGGGHDANVFWRAPDSERIWAGEVTLWPQGQRLSWQVARPWPHH